MASSRQPVPVADVTRVGVKVLAVVAMLGWLASPAAGQGQTQAPTGFLSGPFTWRPVIAVRDAGLDSNVFDEPVNPKEDRMVTFAPQVDASMITPRFKLAGSTQVEAVYFERYANQRAINRRATVRMDFPVPRIVPFLSGTYERARDRQGPEINLRASREVLGGATGFTLSVTPRSSLQGSVGTSVLTFDTDQTFRERDLAQLLNRETQTATLGLRYQVTPLTTFGFDATVARDLVQQSARNTEDLRATLSLAFAPDAVIRGRATLVYHKLSAQEADLPFEGFAADVDLSYTILGVTRVQVRYNRDTNFSLEAPFFLSETYGVDVQQRLVGPLDGVARGQWQTLDYPGILRVNLPARLDRNDLWSGGLALQVTRAARLIVVYEEARRRSTLITENIDFSRRRLLASLTYILG